MWLPSSEIVICIAHGKQRHNDKRRNHNIDDQRPNDISQAIQKAA